MTETYYDKFSEMTERPSLLLHSCCAPCSSYCLVYMRRWFDITCLYYNPNITNREEYEKRSAELCKLADVLNDDFVYVEDGRLIVSSFKPPFSYSPIKVITCDFTPDIFTEEVTRNNLQNCPERGERCSMCFSQRLAKTFEVACQNGFDYFATTLTLSPLKNAEVINEIGNTISQKGNDLSAEAADNDEYPKWLYTDFKNKNGYKISIELSKRYDLYRQNYCGCEYSKRKIQDR